MTTPKWLENVHRIDEVPAVQGRDVVRDPKIVSSALEKIADVLDSEQGKPASEPITPAKP